MFAKSRIGTGNRENQGLPFLKIAVKFNKIIQKVWDNRQALRVQSCNKNTFSVKCQKCHAETFNEESFHFLSNHCGCSCCLIGVVCWCLLVFVRFDLFSLFFWRNPSFQNAPCYILWTPVQWKNNTCPNIIHSFERSTQTRSSSHQRRSSSNSKKYWLCWFVHF